MAINSDVESNNRLIKCRVLLTLNCIDRTSRMDDLY